MMSCPYRLVSFLVRRFSTLVSIIAGRGEDIHRRAEMSPSPVLARFAA